ncbi:glycosyl transferase, group 1 [Myxococcus xanthus DK 1622]|uniref:Glycosyl transferase, group 1 n=1 Tax=Myxococcus xanthus (strain DK1622) TaxID=246197 RepID=Q1D6A7_MYXXD|nr:MULTISPECIES: glycosyltransferase family 4 protein [Myxococcus]ABF87708.1 glycosyl transferase, group 1 [Myxococcus xanthus DK 1622]NOJ52243.1 glycosyltransferase family 4 protein [Myxococcus xanthus]QPM83028.1 glycosyltransferase family 4 protein [Myxococcus xanthus]QVW65334.1 glycosyltransferase family 4 protein [Myxococcus xanthus DZ2]QZZ51322.1 Alpha-maltose-1-phosphate synthase [Myxococcus xanthus]
MAPPISPPLKALLLAMEYTPNVAGGVGTYVYELARGLARGGCKVTVLAYTPGEPAVLREPNLTVHMMPPSRGSLSQAGKLSLVGGIRVFNDDLIHRGRELIHEEKPDLIHFHQWHTHRAARALAHETGVPVLGTSHYISEPAERWWGQTPDPEILEEERSFYDGSTNVISVSDSMSELIRETYGMPASLLHTIHCGMDAGPFLQPSHAPEDYARLRATVATPDDPVVLYTGRLHPMKGISAIFAAAERVLERRPNVRFLLAGGTDSRESTQMVQTLTQRYAHLRHRIKLLGKLPRQQLGLLHRIADLALVPSLYEPFGYTAIEAMASGLPLVATRSGGPSEIVDHEKTGLLVPVLPGAPGGPREVDVESLAAAQLNLLEDRERARRMGLAGQQRVVELFSLPRMVAANLAVYQKLVGGQGREVRS